MIPRGATVALFLILTLVGRPAAGHGDALALAAPAGERGANAELTVPAEARGLIAVEPARAASPDKWLRCLGQVVPAPESVVDVNAYVSGEVRRVFVRPGDRVRAGAPVMSIYSPEFISTQRGHVALFDNKERLEILREEGRLPDYLKDAEENLKWWGMSASQIAALMNKGTIVAEITLEAPADGIVTDVFVQPGTVINAGDKTMKAFLVTGKSVARIVADGAAPWIEGSLLSDQAATLPADAAVRVETGRGAAVVRHVTRLLPNLEPRTQRSRFLVDLHQPVPGLELGRVVPLRVRLSARPGVWLSRQAVLAEGLAPVVYVRLDPGRFQRRAVEVIDETSESVRVRGVEAGEQVVVAGKMALEGMFRMSAGAAGSREASHHDH